MITTTDVATYIDNGETIEFNYYLDVPMSRKLAFVDSVVDAVVGDDYYYPMLKDIMFNFRMVQFFTDIDTGVVNYGDAEEDVVDQIVDFVERTNAADILKISINFDVVQELYDAVDKLIEYKTGIHPSPIADGIAKFLDTVEKKFADIDVDAMTGMAKVFGKLQGDITPDKMLDAYAKSDIFKKQHEDVVKNQKKRDKAMEQVRENVAKNNIELSVVKGNISTDGFEIVSVDDTEKKSKKNMTVVE